MVDRELTKKFLTAIAKDDYIEADKHFPELVKSALKDVINKRKPKIIDEINTTAGKTAADSITQKAEAK